MSGIRANLVEAAVRAEVEHVEAGHRAKAALRRLTDDERQAALIEASERVLARIRASFVHQPPAPSPPASLRVAASKNRASP